MVFVLENDFSFFNQYGIMAVNLEKIKTVKYKEAMKFVNCIISEKGQDASASYKDENNNHLFTERKIGMYN